MSRAALAQLAKAVESTDPFALARVERPGCKYIRIVDRRTRNNLGVNFVIACPPGGAWYELMPEDQTVALEDDPPTTQDLTAP